MKSTEKSKRSEPRVPVVDVDEFVRWYQLHALAKLLNGDTSTEWGPMAEQLRPLARQVVTACVGRPPTAPIPRAAAAPFNRLAAATPFTFALAPQGGAYDQLVASRGGEQHRLLLNPGSESGLMISCADWRGQVVKLLVDYFGHASPGRLKRCPLCGRWFVDQTRNNTRLRCSLACTWRWWSRDRRRQAGHAPARHRGVKKRRRPTRASRRGPGASRVQPHRRAARDRR
jgi:hypothetical protein